MPTDIDPTEGPHIAPLSTDTVPDGNQSHHCLSCEHPFTGLFTGLYCANCGQKNDNFRRSIVSLVNEVFQSFTAIESRIWRTWAALLFKPGKVAREYADGRRTHWSSPVRVYLAMSLLLFGFLGVMKMQLISFDIDVKPRNGVEASVESLNLEELKLSFSVHFFETRKRINARNATRNFDLIRHKIEGDGGVKLEFDENNPDGPVPLTKDERARIKAAKDQLDPLASSGTDGGITFSGFDGKQYHIESWSDIVLQTIQDPTKLNAAFYTYLPRILFFMMPFTMLIGVLFIRGRDNALMYDHLVHAAYIHAVAFFLLFIGIVLGLIWPENPMPVWLFLAMVIYLPLSLKRMFGRGWIKTIWTSYGVGFIYAFNLSLLMLLLFLLQITRTATEIATPLSP